MKLSLKTAQKLAVIKQALHQRPASADKATLLDVMRKIRLLQMDTVSVVARSHYLVMLSRIGLYNPDDLDALLYPDRQVFEQWAHAMCRIPVEDYEYFAPIIKARQKDPLNHWRVHKLGDNPQEVLDWVLDEIRKNGPMASKNFRDTSDGPRGWWDWKPAKVALDILSTNGVLMVNHRNNFQMYYDLAERVLPASAESPTKPKADYQRWAVLRSIGCLGVATVKHACDYYRQKKPTVQSLIEALEAEGAVIPVEVEGWKDTAYVLPEDLPLINEIEAGQHQPQVTTFLSPFDNLTWNRDRLSELFGFEYTIEMYLPQAKRKFGYYVLPILQNGRFVGRLDPKADRKTRTLLVHKIALESGEKMTDELVTDIAGALREFMEFHGSEQLTIKQSEPKSLRTAILKQI